MGTLPTGLMGLTLKEPFERFYKSVPMVGVMLIITGVILMVPWIVNAGKKQDNNRTWNPKINASWVALAIGTAQGFAIIPGISRSGITIACGLLCGLNRDLAGRFSFLLSIPMIIGWNVMNLSGKAMPMVGLPDLFLGFITAALVGLSALKLLMSILRRGRLHYFAPYCLVVGFLVIMLAQ
jgi:undecaprenyl-diphosphatase